MELNIFIIAGFGLANLICAALVLKMPYRRHDRIIPMMITTLGLLAWIIGMAGSYTIHSETARGVYNVIDVLILMLAITAVQISTYRVWAILLAVVTGISILNTGVVVPWTMPEYIQPYTAAVLNNVLYGLQILLVTVSAFNDTIRVQLNRSRNKHNYFKPQS
jgi:hypothetical protein